MNSLWFDTTKSLGNKFPTLNENISVDVCIVGGGLVGVHCAYFLSDSNLKVAVLERNDICAHISGHSTAKITSQHNLFYDYLIQSFDKNFAKGYLQANQDAVERN